MKAGKYSDEERAIVVEEVKAGPGWCARAMVRIPERTQNSLNTFASATGILGKFGLGKGGNVSHVGDHAIPPRPSRQPSPRPGAPVPKRQPRENVPLFLREVYAGWSS